MKHVIEIRGLAKEDAQWHGCEAVAKTTSHAWFPVHDCMVADSASKRFLDINRIGIKFCGNLGSRGIGLRKAGVGKMAAVLRAAGHEVFCL